MRPLSHFPQGEKNVVKPSHTKGVETLLNHRRGPVGIANSVQSPYF